MIEWLPRIVPEAPDRPDPLPIVGAMQQTTRETATVPGSWTSERARQVAAMFDSLASGWGQHANERRHEALRDAIERGGVDSRGITLEVGSGSGNFTPWLSERLSTLVAVDISLEMLKMAPADVAPRVCADACALPVPDGAVSTVVLVNCFLFPREVNRVLSAAGRLVWVSTFAERTPIYLSPEEVDGALPGSWSGVASEAGWGSWAVFTRGPAT